MMLAFCVQVIVYRTISLILYQNKREMLIPH